MRTKIIIFFCLLIIFSLAIVMRVSMPHFLKGFDDGYQTGVIGYFETGIFNSGVRATYYSLLVFFSTVITKDYDTLLNIQVGLGILSIGLFGFVYLRSSTLQKSFLPTDFLFYAVGILFFSLFALSPNKIDMEFWPRPESISHFIEVIFLLLAYKLIKGSKNNTFLFLLSLVSIFAVFYQIKFLYISIFNLILIIFSILKQPNPIIKKYILISFIVVTPLFGFVLFNKIFLPSDSKYEDYKYETLFWRNQKIIMKVIQNDYRNNSFITYDKKILKTAIDFYDSVKDVYPQNKNISMGDFNMIMYEKGDVLKKDINELSSIDQASYKFMKYYVNKSIVRQPVDYILAYLYEIHRVYRLFNSDLIFYQDIDYPATFSHIYDYFNDSNMNLTINSRYFQTIQKFKNQKDNILSFGFLNPIYSVSSSVYMPLLVVFLLIFSYIQIFAKDNFQTVQIGYFAMYSSFAAFLMYSFTSMTLLYLDRYLIEILPFYLMSEALMLVYIKNTFSYFFFPKKNQ